MSRTLTTLAATALALTLILTGQAMAQLRMAPKAADVIEICTGHGPMRVLAGPDGAPLAPGHICPDCVMLALADLCPPQGLPGFAPRASRLVAERTACHAASRADVRPSARSPPAA